MKLIIDKSTALTIAPKLAIDYSEKRQALLYRNLVFRSESNILGYIAAGVQFLASLHKKRG